MITKWGSDHCSVRSANFSKRITTCIKGDDHRPIGIQWGQYAFTAIRGPSAVAARQVANQRYTRQVPQKAKKKESWKKSAVRPAAERLHLPGQPNSDCAEPARMKDKESMSH
jgi:hypothetical protein